ncbi:hypothetical protein HDU92_003123 [Lobulomyces angularis]|nr:hypothetical protein HDU92_003123 [Lobulomyces angularis]
MNSDIEEILTFGGVGVLLSIMGYTVYSHLRTPAAVEDKSLLAKKKKIETVAKTEDVLSIEALAELTKSDNINLMESAVRILLDRAMSEKVLPDIVKACSQKNKKDKMAQMAIATLHQLTKDDVNRKILIKVGIIKVLVNVLITDNGEEYEPTDTTKRYVVIALFRLIQGSDKRKLKAMKYGLTEKLMEYLCISPSHNNDLKYWSLLLLHQFFLSEQLHGRLIELNITALFGEMARKTFGNSNMQKLCLHSLVRLISSMDNSEGSKQLAILFNLNMVPLITCCLRNDDMELVSWAVFLLHEFMIKDVARKEFCESPGLLKILLALLSEDNCIPRVLLRCLKCLGVNNEEYQMEMVKANVVKKTLPFLKNSDEDAQYWALSLLHDLISFSESHKSFLENDGLETLTTICIMGTPNLHVALYIADIFVYICSSPSNHDHVLHSDILDAVISFCKMENHDAQYGGVALLLNLATLSVPLINEMADVGVLEMLVDLILESDRDSIQTVSSKTLTAIAKKCPHLRYQLVQLAIVPIINKINELIPVCINSIFPEGYNVESPTSPDTNRLSTTTRLQEGANEAITVESFLSNEDKAENSNKKLENLKIPEVDLVLTARLIGLLDSLTVFVKTDFFDILHYERWGVDGNKEVVSIQLESLLSQELIDHSKQLLDILVLPLLNEDVIMAAKSPQQNTPTTITPTIVKELGSEEMDLYSPGIEYIGNIRDEFLGHVQSSLSSSFDGRIGRHTVDMNESIDSNIEEKEKKLEEIKELKDDVAVHVCSLISSLMKYNNVKEFLLQEKIFTVLIALTQEKRVGLYEQALTCIALCAKEDEVDKTFSLMLTDWEIRNESWTFESIRSNLFLPASVGGKYGYEVVLKSDGIIQIGWATFDCNFDPEAGTGVGDDVYSYAYDGQRRKKWHGTEPKNNSYGEEWFAGDTITVLIDLDKSEISYLRNGIDLGVAFENINSDANWFPAISMASNQGCSVNMGNELDPLSFLPSKYLPVASLLFPKKMKQNEVNVTNSLGEFFRSDAAPSGSPRSSPLSELSPSSSVGSATKPFGLKSDSFSLEGDSQQSPGKLSNVIDSSSVIKEEADNKDEATLGQHQNFAQGYSNVSSKRGDSHYDALVGQKNLSYLNDTTSEENEHHLNVREEFSNFSSIGNGSQSDNREREVVSPTTSNESYDIRSQSPVSTINSPISNADETIDLSFYFEVAVGLKGNHEKMYPQIGIYDRHFNNFFVFFFEDKIFLFDIEQTDPEDHEFFDFALIEYIKNVSTGLSPTTSAPIKLLKILENFPLKEGDVIGVGLYLNDKKILFTFNGM